SVMVGVRPREARASDFFFQAEGGIRDFHVTGVQTCALPISRSTRTTAGSGLSSQRAAGSTNSGMANGFDHDVPRPSALHCASSRSEERRVGKEDRCGGGADGERNRLSGQENQPQREDALSTT